MNQQILVSCLDSIEEQECRALIWCVATGRFPRPVLASIVLTTLDKLADIGHEDAARTTADEVIDELERRGLIVRVEEDDEEDSYRSRMAETVRLMSQLRQLFPKHAHKNGWMRAPNLVADYRLLRRPRRYPRRNLEAQDVLGNLPDNGEFRAARPWLATMLKRGAPMLLSGFQLRAIRTILANLDHRRSRGTVVCAGTGSGKTLAFYLPALSAVSAEIASHPDAQCWTQVVAVYPRTELLKDQMTEILRESVSLSDALIAGRQGRAISVGAFFGATPRNIADLQKWDSNGVGHACPYLKCPVPGCDGPMYWLFPEIRANKEILTCAKCNHKTHDGQVILTRKNLSAQPPDILFTTTEMMNQRLSDPHSHHLFGVGPRVFKAPRMCLLDEIHTYSGTHGAMVGYLMRRWQALVNRPMTFVGLSATLREAQRFFADLVGLREDDVTEVAPDPTELESDGVEYMLALRGDPVSRTALLSTTIQATMLMQRSLDKRVPGGGSSEGLYGCKTFVFTDDIDVTNRLYFNLLDAEGRLDGGAIAPKQALAQLRAKANDRARYLAGQDWRFCERTGHDLRDRMEIGRTSSQDAGVNSSADIIVATAALEVGFNDPEVGAVIQHKAPRGVDQFLQRKGRAGRPRAMRPWTVVVLSDYGRDRETYQAYDALFDPELEARTLPMTNRHVRKMQGTYALLDYLGMRQHGGQKKVNVWSALSGPWDGSGGGQNIQIVRDLENILSSDGGLAEFKHHLKRALSLDDAGVEAVLWDYPRPLLTTAIPTAMRRLRHAWRGFDGRTEPHAINSPLPEFVPSTLFSDLELPEVRIALPERHNREDHPAMPVHRALREYAPGRISHRYGVSRRMERHWICFEHAGADGPYANVASYCTATELGTVTVPGSLTSELVPLLRPHVIKVAQPQANVRDNSNAFPAWGTEFIAPHPGSQLDAPCVENWQQVVSEVSSFLHARANPITVRRFVHESRAEVQFNDGTNESVKVKYVHGDKRVTLGFETTVDAVRIGFIVPRDLLGDAMTDTSGKWRALRVARYYEAARDGLGFTAVVNPFARSWLAQIQMVALACHAIRAEESLEMAVEAIHELQAHLEMKDVLAVVFQSDIEDGGVTGHDLGDGVRDKLRVELEEYLGRDDVCAELRALTRYLVDPIESTDPDWLAWVEDRYIGTLAAAVMDAVRSLCPAVDESQVLVDIVPAVTATVGARQDEMSGQRVRDILLSETCPGGGGYIEEFVRNYVEDPRRFFTLLRAALDPCELEQTDSQMQAVIDLLAGHDDGELSEAVCAFRDAVTPFEKDEALKCVRRRLESIGLLAYHSFVVSLCGRMLRPGTGPEFDAIMQSCLERWRGYESSLGIEIDNRVAAFLLSDEIAIEDGINLDGSLDDTIDIKNWRYDALYGLFWPRGATARCDHLGTYNPYAQLTRPEPLLCRARLAQTMPAVVVSRDDPDGWARQVAQHLAEHGEVVVSVPARDTELAKWLFCHVVTNPVDLGSMMCHPRIRAVKRRESTVRIELEVVEVIQ